MLMPELKKNNPSFVTRTEFKKVDLALFGSDGRGGIVKDIGDIKSSIKTIENAHKEEKRENRRFTGLIYSIIGGSIVAVITYFLSSIP